MNVGVINNVYEQLRNLIKNKIRTKEYKITKHHFPFHCFKTLICTFIRLDNWFVTGRFITAII